MQKGIIMRLNPASSLRGEITVPGDKSISHRSIMFGSLAKGTTEIDGFLNAADCLSTIDCFRRMGVRVEENVLRPGHVLVHGLGLRGLHAPDGILDVGDSGTTARLISGILSAQNFTSRLTGDELIQKRPMKRIMTPLSAMGARIASDRGNGCLPLTIEGCRLSGTHYDSPVASAQVKSSILLAGLYADGETSVTEPTVSRDHTERMLSAFGADLQTAGTTVSIRPADELHAQKILVPGDISSAAYFITASLITPNAEVLIRNVGINPTRDGILRVYKRMGAHITILNPRESSGEPVADLLVRSSHLSGTEMGGAEIPTMIDELPVIAVAAAFAEGTTVIRDAAELRVKESDRIAVMTAALTAMGADVTPTDDGMIIRGGKMLHGAAVETRKDHRIAMSCAVASLAASGETEILDAECVDISYPEFYRDLKRLTVQ